MSQMITIPVEELQGRPLDWAVCMAEGGSWLAHNQTFEWTRNRGLTTPIIPYSSQWAHGGPLIQGYGVLISPPDSYVHRLGFWGATTFMTPRQHRRHVYYHSTEPLIAAMRAIVNWHFGEEISIPAELLEGDA